MLQAGPSGGLRAWLGFTLPFAIALTLFAFGVERFDLANASWIHGLKVVAVAAQAIWGIAGQFCADNLRISVAIVTVLVILAAPSSAGQVLVIVLAGLFGRRFLPPASSSLRLHAEVPINRRAGIAALPLFFGLPLLRLALHSSPDGALALFEG